MYSKSWRYLLKNERVFRLHELELDSRISEASAKELICTKFDTTKRNILIWLGKKAIVLDITCKPGKLVLKFSKDCVKELACKKPEDREKLIRAGEDLLFVLEK